MDVNHVSQLNYWMEKLKNAASNLELPFDYETSERKNYKSQEWHFNIEEETYNSLIEIAQKENTDILSVLLTALKILLYRYTWEEDILVGTLRKDSNTLIIRTDIFQNQTFLQLLGRVSTAISEAEENSDISYEGIIQALNKEYNANNLDLLQIMMIENDNISLEDYTCDLCFSISAETKFIIKYNASLFDALTISRMQKHYQMILNSVCQNPEQTVGAISILTQQEREQILTEWIGYKEEYCFEKSISELFEQQAEKTPDDTAVIFEDKNKEKHKLTYDELNNRANYLGNKLKEYGVGAGITVGVYAERSLYTFIGLLSVLKAGGVYVPIDSANPPDQVDFILKDAEISILLTVNELSTVPTDYKGRVFYFEDTNSISCKYHNLSLTIPTDQLALIMYTSGSTGKPKGVKHRQRQVINRINWMWSNYPFCDGDIFCQRTTVNFMPSMWELLGGLLKGIPTVILCDRIVKDPHRLIKALYEHKITYTTVVPSLLKMILDTDLDLEYYLKNIRMIVTAGEPLTLELYKRFCKCFPSTVLLNDYGATEINGVLYFDSNSCKDDMSRLPGMKPVANIKIYILDSQMQPVPIGIPGELHIGGVSLALGYLNQPELTKEKFVPNPFSSEPEEVLFKLGDMAKFLSDGTIQGLGRRDNQIKIRGIRVELDGIEETLNQHPFIKDNIVIAKERKSGGKKLIAYVVPKADAADINDELYRFLKDKLPEYMIPSAFYKINDVPYNLSGKKDRKKMREYKEGKNKSQSYQLYSRNSSKISGALKSKAAEILELEVDEINIDKKYYELGFDSATLVEFINIINRDFAVKLSVTDIYDYPTLKDLSYFLTDKLKEAKDVSKIHYEIDISNTEATMPQDEKAEISDIIRALTRTSAEILEIKESEIKQDKKYYELGFDSASLVEFINSINKSFNAKLSITDSYDYPTLKDLATYLSLSFPIDLVIKDYNYEHYTENSKKMDNSKAECVDKKIQNRDKVSGIAVIGISGRFPKAQNINEYWENLEKGLDCIIEVPKERWSNEEYFDPDIEKPYKTPGKWGGFLDNIDKFDSKFFNISRKEAEFMDPQQRICLEECWKALEDAGYSESTLSDSSVGVFIGMRPGNYIDNINSQHIPPNAYTLMGSDLAILSARIAYYLNIKGPAVSIDTACSSSLVAIHTACKSIESRECEMALAGGICVHSSPSLYLTSGKLGMLSPVGKCKTFDTNADGFVPGEGAGFIVLKSAEKAIKDRDYIYGIIKASGINQDGKTNGITAPSAASQSALEEKVYREANINPESISYIEAHGTGTKLGDPIEIKALTETFRKWTERKQFCAIGSVKTNIGHAVAGAGIAGFIKLILSLKNKRLVPSLNFKIPNEYIDFENSPFYVNTESKEWLVNEGQIRRGAISSFGFSGTNCHIVVEETLKTPVVYSPEKPYYIITLSAKTQKALYEKHEDLLNWLEIEEQNHFLQDIEYTINAARSHFAVRAVFIVKDIYELKQKLRAVMQYRSAEDYYSSLKSSVEIRKEQDEETLLNIKNYVDIPSKYKEKLENLAVAYINGQDIGWGKLYTDDSYNKISIPTYPFGKESFWIPAAESRNSVYRETRFASKLHPLIDSNISTLAQQRYKVCFSGEEFYLKDHVINNKKILPGVAYIEMARGAGELALGKKVNKIKDILWLEPIVMEEMSKSVYIAIDTFEEEIEYKIITIDRDNTEIINGRGRLLFEHSIGHAAPCEFINITEIIERCTKRTGEETCYKEFSAAGLDYGQSFRGIKTLCSNEREALSLVKVNEEIAKDLESFVIHPAIADAALQTVSGLYSDIMKKAVPYLPFFTNEVEIIKPLQHECYVYAVPSLNNNADGSILKFDITVTDIDGEVLLKIKDFSQKSVKNIRNTSNAKQIYYRDLWTTSSIEESCDVKADIGNLLVISDNTLMGTSLKNQISKNSRGKITFAKLGECYNSSNSGIYEIDLKSKSNYKKLLEELRLEKALPEKVLFIWTKEKCEEMSTKLDKSFYSAFYLMQALLESSKREKLHVMFVYNYEQDNIQPEYEALAGFAKSIGLENSRFTHKSIAFRFSGQSYKDSEVDFDRLASMILKELRQQDTDEAEIYYDNDSRYVKKLQLVNLEDASNSSAHLKINGTYIISGGAGGLGFVFAEYLAKEWRANLVLAGRSELCSQQKLKIERLKAAGAEVLYAKADISQWAEAEELVRVAKLRFGKIDGIIHSAGVIRDALISKKSADEIQQVLAPKIYGVLNLDRALKHERLDFFVMFSSIASVIGNIGQCDYSYANRYMDVFARIREKQRNDGKRYGRTLSVNWPLWRDGGMKVDAQTENFYANTMGIEPLESEEGLNAFMRMLQSDACNMGIVKGKQDILKGLLGINEKEVKPSFQKANSQKLEVSGKNIFKSLQKDIIKIACETIKENEKDMDADAHLNELGFDSIMMTEFANKLNKLFGLKIMLSIFFEFSSINEICKYLFEKYMEHFSTHYNISTDIEYMETKKDFVNTGDKKNNAAISRDVRKISESKNMQYQKINTKYEAIAIVGMGGIMPQSQNLEEFWNSLIDGRSLITEVPKDRWDWKEYYGDHNKEINKTNIKWGGFMKEVDKFDAAFFGISPREAELMDPQQRILLETVWRTIEDAGYKAAALSGTKTGVFVGAFTNDYEQLLSDYGIPIDGHTSTGLDHSILANRVSYLMNLKGPSEVIDTACASAAVALHRAVRAIHNGECTAAIVGGVNVLLSPEGFIKAAKAGMLSEDGEVRSFDKDASGYLRGEGVGAVLIKPLAKAQADNDHIYAIIKGSAVNHGGRSHSLTAPSVGMQADAIVSAYENADITSDTISYIEAHGTGTKLGDSIEIEAYKKAFEKTSKAWILNSSCGIGSIKPNVGHLEAASSMASLIKLLLAFKYRKLPKTINIKEINPQIELQNSPFYVVNETIDWKPLKDDKGRELPRRAGLHSFGFGGVNAHIVLEEYIENEPAEKSGAEEASIAIFSAKNKERLKEYIAQIREFAVKNQALNIKDLTFTLQNGREEMNERAAFVIYDLNDFISKCDMYLGVPKASHIEEIYENNIKLSKSDIADLIKDEEGKQIIDIYINCNNLQKIAMLWTKGADIDWSRLYGDSQVQRISIPTYPFERKRHWILDKYDCKDKKEIFNYNNEPNEENALAYDNLSPLDMLKRYLESKIRNLLGVAANTLSPDSSLSELGFDSIMALKFKHEAESDMDLSIPMAVLGAAEDINRLADYIYKQKDVSGILCGSKCKTNLKEAFLNRDNDLSDITEEELNSLYDEFKIEFELYSEE